MFDRFGMPPLVQQDLASLGQQCRVIGPAPQGGFQFGIAGGQEIEPREAVGGLGKNRAPVTYQVSHRSAVDRPAARSDPSRCQIDRQHFACAQRQVIAARTQVTSAVGDGQSGQPGVPLVPGVPAVGQPHRAHALATHDDRTLPLRNAAHVQAVAPRKRPLHVPVRQMQANQLLGVPGTHERPARRDRYTKITPAVGPLRLRELLHAPHSEVPRIDVFLRAFVGPEDRVRRQIDRDVPVLGGTGHQDAVGRRRGRDSLRCGWLLWSEPIERHRVGVLFAANRKRPPLEHRPGGRLQDQQASLVSDLGRHVELVVKRQRRRQKECPADSVCAAGRWSAQFPLDLSRLHVGTP